MRINIFGCNIEALTTAVVMASLGHDVFWQHEEVHISALLEQYAFEHQLIALWRLYRHDGKIHITSIDSLKKSQVCWLFIDGVTENELPQALTLIDADSKVVLSGHAPVGQIETMAFDLNTAYVFFVPFVFLQDGASFASMLTPSLLLIGEKTKGSLADFVLLEPLLRNAQKLATSTIKNTELARSSIMAMLASRLSFMNEISRLADALNIDINKVKLMMGLDKRIGNTYLNPSWGFGGQTLPHALELLQKDFEQVGVKPALINAVNEINQDQKELIFRKFWQFFDSFVGGKTVLIWGAGYKAGSGRTQNSAIHPLLTLMWQHHVATWVYDDYAVNELESLYKLELQEGVLQMTTDPYAQLSHVDALFILNWPGVDRPDIAELVKHDIPVFDAQNLLTNKQITQLKGYYTGIGRGVG